MGIILWKKYCWQEESGTKIYLFLHFPCVIFNIAKNQTMKNIVNLLLVAVSLIAFGCGSKSSAPVVPMVYTVNGISDVTVRQYQDTNFVLVTNSLYSSGPQETLELKVTSMPTGVTVSPSTSSGTPTFGSIFTFHAVTTAAGTFPITLTATSASSGTKTYTFNLIVTPSAGMNYSLSTLSDITVPQYTYQVPVSLTATYNSGLREALVLTASGTGLSSDSTNYNGIPTFSRTINIRKPFNAPGTYPVTINASSTSTGTQPHNFNIIVTPSSDCSPEIGASSPGSAYTTFTTCTSYSGVGTGAGTGNIITIGSNTVTLQVPFINLTGHLNCSAGTLTTDATSNADFSAAAGSGTFTGNTIVVNYTLSGGITSGCTTTFTR